MAAAPRGLVAAREAERVRRLHPRRGDARAAPVCAPPGRAHRDPLARPAAAGCAPAGRAGPGGAGEGRPVDRARAARVTAQPELLVVALEAGADLHGAAVLRELKGLRPDLGTVGGGGPRMRAGGVEALVRA